jgi:5-methylthioadenosine/S-adenosylhomocysteine deaminase
MTEPSRDPEPSEGVDLLLTGGTVLTMDAGWTVLADGAVAIRAGRIVAVGPRAALATASTAAETVDCAACAVLPGLINGHIHLPMTPFRGLGADRSLAEWLSDYIFPAEQRFVDAAFVRIGSRLGAAELVRGGTTTFVDMYYFEEEVAAVADEVGLRAVCGQALLALPAPDAPTPDEGLARAERFLADWRGHPRITPAVAPHAPYTGTPELYRAASRLAERFGVPLVTHLSETAAEVATSQARWGASPIAWAEGAGAFDGQCIAAHCVHVAPEDVARLVRRGVGVVPCPTSNLKLACGVAPYARLLAAGVRLGLGTDGAASNDDLDLWTELHLAALLPKGLSGDPTLMPAREALALVTRRGAEAIHQADEIGSLEAGKRADVTIVRLDGLHTTPRHHADPESIYSTLVYATHAADVRDVLVDGRFLLRDGRLTTIDGEAARAEAQRLADRIDEWQRGRTAPLTSGHL